MMERPSGAQANASELVTPGPGKVRSPDLSERTTPKSAEGAVMNAMFAPSGDHFGSSCAPGPPAASMSPLPSAPTTRMSVPPGTTAWYAMRVPSGDHDGAVPPRATLATPPPSSDVTFSDPSPSDPVLLPNASRRESGDQAGLVPNPTLPSDRSSDPSRRTSERLKAPASKWMTAAHFQSGESATAFGAAYPSGGPKLLSNRCVPEPSVETTTRPMPSRSVRYAMRVASGDHTG